MLVEIVGSPPHALINGDGLSAASMSYQSIHGSADLSPLWLLVHDAGHLVIEISPMCHSILGLCSMSHVCPRIIIVWLMLVTWNVTHLEWSLYCTLRSTTLVMCLALLGVPSMM